MISISLCARKSVLQKRNLGKYLFSLSKKIDVSRVSRFSTGCDDEMSECILPFFFLIQNLLKRSIGKYLAGYFRVSIEGGCACTVSGA